MRFCLLCLVLLSSLPSHAVEPNKARQVELRNLLKHDCGSCHGLYLKGGLGPALLASNLRHKSDDFLIDTIQNGRKNTAMPPWKPFITIEETRWLVTILKSNSTPEK